MTWLGEKPDTVFVGQSVAYGGQRAHQTFVNVPLWKRIEMPVSEDFQMGFCNGLALAGKVPMSFFPRMDFLILGMNQLVNHLDKLPIPKVIIRTAVGASEPLDPGPQHTQNHVKALQMMLRSVRVLELLGEQEIMPAYAHAWETPGSFILVEHMAKY